MVGASMLSAEAALRTGVGSVKVLCSKDTFPIFALKFTSLLKKEINNFDEFKKFVSKNKDSVYLIGPGAGVSLNTLKKTTYLLKNIKYVVLDADALTVFKKKTKLLHRLLDENKIITPHIKEFHTIFPIISKKITNYKKIYEASKICKTNIILKGPKTLISSSYKNIILNNHASSELAVIGSGDVLCGIVASLVGKNKLTPFLACCAAVWIHGDIARKFGPGLIAEDIVKNIPNCLRKLKNR